MALRRPILLDLFCGAGGASMGYHCAGFDVVGVDIAPQPHYPFAFVLTEALEFCRIWGGDFDAIHGSPPCQEYSTLRSMTNKQYPALIDATRTALQQSGKPWVIENVPGAPLHCPIILCGTMFGLRTYRHRLFESPALFWKVQQPYHLRHSQKASSANRKFCWDLGGFATVTGNIGSYCGPEAMGIDWMTGRELSQAIPPAYTQWIGERLLAAL